MSTYEWEELRMWLLEQKAIDDSVLNSDSISRLDLSSRSLNKLPESFGLLTGLVALNLSSNELSSLPNSFSELKNLSNLDIRRNSFEMLPDVIADLTIRSINASGNKLVDISVLQKCNEIRVLDLSVNNLKHIESFLHSGNDLRTLNLSSNYIKEIDGIVKNLQKVERLNLSSNTIESIPESIEALESIEELDLSGNYIETICDNFFKLDVEIIDLSSNSLKEISLHSLKSLERLILDNNEFTSFFIEDDFAPYLNELSCDSCNLKEFFLPASTSLKVLCYSSNKIYEIPNEIGKYNNLQELDIDGNNIEELPDSLANLVYLQTFYAVGNPLSEKAKKVVEVLSPDICDLNMKSGITIEKPQNDDLVEMANLLSILFAIESDFTFDFEKQLAGITKLFNYSGADLLVAKYESKVIGMITMQRLISSAEGGYVGQIEDLVVKDEFRKMGVGSRLINKMRSIAQEYNYKRIQLAADVDNSNALQFYNRRGFSKTHLNVYHYIV